MVEVGERAPDFELLDTDLKVRRLSDFLGKGKPVMTSFPPLRGGVSLWGSRQLPRLLRGY
jgi:peroxiredoxin